MQKVIICDDDQTEISMLFQQISLYFSNAPVKANIVVCQDWPKLAEELMQEEADLVVVALNGVPGLNTVTGILPLARRILWISDLDFAIQAYRLCIPYFLLKPFSYEKMKRALDACLQNRFQ